VEPAAPAFGRFPPARSHAAGMCSLPMSLRHVSDVPQEWAAGSSVHSHTLSRFLSLFCGNGDYPPSSLQLLQVMDISELMGPQRGGAEVDELL